MSTVMITGKSNTYNTSKPPKTDNYASADAQWWGTGATNGIGTEGILFDCFIEYDGLRIDQSRNFPNLRAQVLACTFQVGDKWRFTVKNWLLKKDDSRTIICCESILNMIYSFKL